MISAAVPWALPALPGALAGPDAAAPPHSALVVTPAPVSAAAVASPVGRQRPDRRPLRLIVPGLRVDSAVVPVSGSTGTVVPPPDPQVLGWWREGARPGDRSGAVMLTGHTVSTGGGALDHLGSLRRGDVAVVRTARGSVRYEVRSVAEYPVASFARRAPTLLGPHGPARLVLVTCSGFDGRQYRSSTVVTAIPVRAAG